MIGELNSKAFLPKAELRTSADSAEPGAYRVIGEYPVDGEDEAILLCFKIFNNDWGLFTQFLIPRGSSYIKARTCWYKTWENWKKYDVGASKAVSTYDMGNYYNDYTLVKFLQEKQGTGITILSGYTGYLFSDLPTDLSDAVNVIAYKGNNQKSGIYSQGFISDSLGHRYTFVADASFSNVRFNKF